ncbi:MAG: hypothetical protein ACYS7Y_32905 [Planctomycetota bacterium]|jgi:hypothetical protein
MKSRCLNVATAIYVGFAILAAHTSLVSPEAVATAGADNQAVVVTSDGTLLDSQRLYRSDEEDDRADKANYTVEVWAASWCGPCRTWKRFQLPALLKAGYEVSVRDIDEEPDEVPEDLEKIPLVCLYYKGDLIEQRLNWKANSLDKFVETRMSFKG